MQMRGCGIRPARRSRKRAGRSALEGGTVAVIGGPQAFTLFLKLGYDCFYLSRAVKVRLPGGLPLFGGDPDAALKAVGLKARPPQRLEDGLILTDWVRAE